MPDTRLPNAARANISADKLAYLLMAETPRFW